jgi:hypothetical protein
MTRRLERDLTWFVACHKSRKNNFIRKPRFFLELRVLSVHVILMLVKVLVEKRELDNGMENKYQK